MCTETYIRKLGIITERRKEELVEELVLDCLLGTSLKYYIALLLS